MTCSSSQALSIVYCFPLTQNFADPSVNNGSFERYVSAYLNGWSYVGYFFVLQNHKTPKKYREPHITQNARLGAPSTQQVIHSHDVIGS